MRRVMEFFLVPIFTLALIILAFGLMLIDYIVMMEEQHPLIRIANSFILRLYPDILETPEPLDTPLMPYRKSYKVNWTKEGF